MAHAGTIRGAFTFTVIRTVYGGNLSHTREGNSIPKAKSLSYDKIVYPYTIFHPQMLKSDYSEQVLCIAYSICIIPGE